jgi:hypothetical protein
LESKTNPTPANLTRDQEQNNSTLNGQPEQQVNSTVVLQGQVQPLTDQTPSVELHSPPNGTLALVTDGQKSTSRAGGDANKTGLSPTLVDNKIEGEDAHKEDVDVSTKIMNKAMSEEEVVPE